MDLRFDTRSVRSLYRIGSFKTAARELGKCKLDLVGVQVRWEKGGTERQRIVHFSMDRGMGIIG
jgi:hypothetical protein